MFKNRYEVANDCQEAVLSKVQGKSDIFVNRFSRRVFALVSQAKYQERYNQANCQVMLLDLFTNKQG